MQTLTVELEDGLYQALKRIAQQLGKTPEEMAVQLVATTVERVEGDPLLALAGTLSSEVTDISQQHDEYIGQALWAEMRGDTDA